VKRTDRVWLTLLLAVLGLALVGPLFADGADATVATGYLSPAQHGPLGTDGLGRDVWLRLAHGGAGLLLVAVIATAAAMLIGIVLGLTLTAHNLVARLLGLLTDLLLVIPSMLTMMVLVFGLGSGVWTMVLIMTVASVPFVARFTRSIATPVLGSDYVLAARAAGDSWYTVFRREVLPNLAPPLLADAGTRLISALYLVAAAGFLGFSPLGGDGDWATMVQAGLEGIRLNPWASLAPALAIAAVTIPANLLADRVMRRVMS